MAEAISFSILNESRRCAGRVGRVQTPHGGFDTPAFMPVGTAGAIKGLTPRQVAETGSQIILNNAYHLMLRPGSALIGELGGVHRFMRWDGPILTDSGGYQAYSMADINAVDDDGVTFKSIIDGAMVHLGPERSMHVQNDLGADIIMAFDDCPPAVDPATLNETRKRLANRRQSPATSDAGDFERDDPGSVTSPAPGDGGTWAQDGGVYAGDTAGSAKAYRRRLEVANERTIRWLERCVAAHRKPDEQALFGIVQGGTDEALRRQSAQQVCGIDLPGYAIGGVAVGEGPDQIKRTVTLTAPLLPADKPRYLMGVGYERDIVMAVRAGVDMFDCVLPTRNGRNANVFTRGGRLHLRNARFGADESVIEPGCDCPTCAGGFSRAYMRHLFQSKEMLGPILASVHNIRHFQRLLLDIRRAIRDDAWPALYRDWPVLHTGTEQPAAASGGSVAHPPNTLEI